MPAAPSSLALARLLQRLHVQQAREAAQTLTLDNIQAGYVPDLTHWIGTTAEAVKPLLLRFWEAGVLRTVQQLGQGRIRPGDKRFEKGVMEDGTGPWMQRRGVPQLFALDGRADVAWAGLGGRAPSEGVSAMCAGPEPALILNGHEPIASVLKEPRRRRGRAYYLQRVKLTPRILDAVDEATLKLCRETVDTATIQTRHLADELRRQLRAGLKRQEALALLTERIQRIFADPARAHRIAVTESARAINGGRFLAAKDAGVKRKRWLISRSPCAICKTLEGKVVPLDKPFHVDPAGGPYATSHYPPIHPHDKCDWELVL